VLRTAGAGTNSANCPLIAVGGTRCNGSNPPKYLNAEFNQVLVRTEGLAWGRAGEGEALPLREGGKLALWAEVGNTGEATWLPPQSATGRQGGVYLVVEQSGKVVARAPLQKEVLRYADGEFVVEFAPAQVSEGEIRLYLEAAERTPFGERYRLRVGRAQP